MKALLQPEKLFKFLMWCIALLFAWFLIGFGGLVIQDLPRVGGNLSWSQFETPEMQQINQNINKVQSQISEKINKRELLQQNLDAADSAYNAEHDNYQNWLSTRATTEESSQNEELLKRTKKLELLKEKAQKINEKIQAINTEILTLNQQIDSKNDSLRVFQNKISEQYEQALFKLELKVFGYRLLFVLPLLIFGVWLFAKKRHSKYWAFVLGYILFALYTFFVELVPYLPSYGGYIRYLVGLILVSISGYYGVRWMQAYLERRKIEEKSSETDRRQKIDNSAAIKKIMAMVCPSCERQTYEMQGVTNNFCMHCGLKLYTACPHCETRHNAFFVYCPTCGKEDNEMKGKL